MHRHALRTSIMVSRSWARDSASDASLFGMRKGLIISTSCKKKKVLVATRRKIVSCSLLDNAIPLDLPLLNPNHQPT